MAGKKPKSPANQPECDQCDYKLSWEREKHFRDVVENSLTGIFIVQDNIVVYLNPEQQRIIGDMHILNAPLPFERVHPEDVERTREAYGKAARGEIKDVDVDFRFFPQGASGEDPPMKWLTCRGCLIEYKGREAMLVNMMDMTRARELEQLLDIQDKMASLGRVAAGLAHEIRNPLSGINIYISMLKKFFESRDSLYKVEGILAQMQEASARIEAVIRRVMDFSKPSEPRFVLGDINRPVEDAVWLSATTLGKADIDLEQQLASDLKPCRIDPRMIEQVVLNLITNAAEAMRDTPGTKRIGVSTRVEKGRIIVRVDDSGPGVPKHLRNKVFDPFYTTKSDSTGIGLSICQRIISDHGGVLRVAESPWGGAEFIIELPVEAA